MGPYEVLKCIGSVSYEFKLTIELAQVYSVFHVLIFKKFISDPVSILSLESLEVDANLSNEEVPLEILDQQVKMLRNKEVASVKDI